MSLHNILPGTVTELSADSTTDTVVVQLAMGNSRLLAEVTRDAVERLNIGPAFGSRRSSRPCRWSFGRSGCLAHARRPP